MGAAIRFDHIHLRSPDPEATARFYERAFGAEVVARSKKDGVSRLDLRLGGSGLFISSATPDGSTAAAPRAPNHGVDHFGLAVSGIDAMVGALRAEGVEITVPPTTVRPGVRIAFLRGPEGVTIELIDRDAPPATG